MHVLLTGASSGIGASMAKHFGTLGWKQTLVARRENMLNELADSIDAQTFVRPADLFDTANCEAVIRDAEEEFGPIDVLINNAGIQYVEHAAGVSPDRIDKIIGVNLVSPLHMIHHTLGSMLERRSGVIVNVASMAGITHTPGMCHYNATKSGLGAASESLRVELKGTGVHVVSVYPGPVYSPMEAAARHNIEETIVGKFAPVGDPDVLAKMTANAITRRKARIVYPRLYGIARYTRIFSQWVTDSFTPKLLPPGE